MTIQQPQLAAVPAERRRNQRLRELYDEAQQLLAPLISHDSAQNNGTALYRAMHKLQATYPELTGSEIEALATAVFRSLTA